VKRELTLPRGVSIRTFQSERRLQVAFSFRGVECRELLPPGPITQTAIHLAAGLRAEIMRRIATNTFVYAEYFPQSPRADQFGHAGRRVMMADLLDARDKAYQTMVANKTLSPSTYDGYTKAIHSERMSFWRTKALAEATPSVLRDWVRSLNVTAKTARNLLTPLRTVFEDALNDELIKVNPFDRIALARLLRETTKASDYEADPFDQAEREQLLARARPDERPMVDFWLHTGLRPGELMALRWSKVDFVRKKVRIDLNLASKTEKLPKTQAGIRDVDLDEAAIAALQAQKSYTLLAGEHVWTNPRTSKAWESDAQLRKTFWQPLCLRAEVRYRNPYQVRHTYASRLLMERHNPWYVAQQLGHEDVQMVFQTYGKFIPADYQRPRLQAVAASAE
jgi:integrase